MKGYKRILTIFILMIFLFPFSVSAKSFSIDENMNLDIDDSLWYVFTRNNLDNNEELKSFNISPSEMMAFFENNQAYMNAILLYKDTGEMLQLFVRKATSNTDLKEKDMSDQDLLDMAKASLTGKNVSTMELYKNNGIRYVYAEYAEGNNYVMDYYTIYNNTNYTITGQKTSRLNSENRDRVNAVVETITFVGAAEEEESENNAGLIIIIVLLIGAVIAGIFLIFNSKKKKPRPTMMNNGYNNGYYNPNQYNNMNGYNNGNYYNNNGNNYYNNNNNY